MNVPTNYLAVLVAAMANMIIGMLWYGPLFGKAWIKLGGGADMKTSPQNLGILFVGALLMAYVLHHALIFAAAYTHTAGISAGVMVGFWNWLGFIAPVTLGVVLWEKKPWSLWVLNNGYWLCSLLVMGIILALWR